VSIVVVTELSDRLTSLIDDAVASALDHRGGPELLRDLCGDETVAEVIATAVSNGYLLVDDLTAPTVFALRSGDVLQAMYVMKEFRRTGRAKRFLEEMLTQPSPPRDALALPGDRATKSLYESVGWKARLLTMRGE